VFTDLRRCLRRISSLGRQTEGGFVAAAEDAKLNCPVSQALAGTTITLTTKLD
jgi:hypothetical protein